MPSYAPLENVDTEARVAANLSSLGIVHGITERLHAYAIRHSVRGSHYPLHPAAPDAPAQCSGGDSGFGAGPLAVEHGPPGYVTV